MALRKMTDILSGSKSGAAPKPHASQEAHAAQEPNPAQGSNAAQDSNVPQKPNAEQDLNALLEKYTTFRKTGFSVDLTGDPKAWDACIRKLGQPKAYELMSAWLCAQYKERYGREYLFDDPCVAFELEYHIAAYLWALGYVGYSRHITTLLFSREQLIQHCESVDISVRDIKDAKQRIIFGYDSGIRPSCREAYEKGEWDI